MTDYTHYIIAAYTIAGIGILSIFITSVMGLQSTKKQLKKLEQKKRK